MAAYPSFPMQRDGSTAEVDAGIQPVRASNGVLKVRRLYSADKARFQAVHWLSDTDLATLLSHYDSHRAASFALTWPHTGLTYTVVYAGAPQQRRMDGFTEVSVSLLEV